MPGGSKGLEVLLKYLRAERPTVVLNSAISLRRIRKNACPVLPQIKKEVKKNHGDKGAGYNSWSYPIFIDFALNQ